MKRLILNVDELAVESFTTHAGTRMRGTVEAAENTVGWTCDAGWTCNSCFPVDSEGYSFCQNVETCWASCAGTCRPQVGCGPDQQDTWDCEQTQFSQIYTCHVGC